MPDRENVPKILLEEFTLEAKNKNFLDKDNKIVYPKIKAAWDSTVPKELVKNKSCPDIKTFKKLFFTEKNTSEYVRDGMSWLLFECSYNEKLKKPFPDSVHHYQGNAKEESIDQAFRQAEREIWVFATNFSQSTRNRYSFLKELLIKGISLKCLVFNHTSNWLEKVAEDLDRKPSLLLSEAEYSYETLNCLIQEIKKERKEFDPTRQIHIKLTEKVPKVLVYVFDPPKEPKKGNPEGITIFMPYMIGRDSKQRAAFECKNIEGGVWNTFYQGIKTEWEKAKPINEVIDCSENYPALNYSLIEEGKSKNN